MANDVLNSEDLISGTYIAVVGTFLAIAGFLVIVSQVFRGIQYSTEPTKCDS